MCQIVQDVRILRIYFSQQKYFGTINFCRKSKDVRKLMCWIAQVSSVQLNCPLQERPPALYNYFFITQEVAIYIKGGE